MVKRILHALGFHIWSEWSNPEWMNNAHVFKIQTRRCLLCNLYKARIT